MHWNHQLAPLVTKTDKYRDRSTNLFISKQHYLQNSYLVTILKGPTKIMWTSYLFREITNFRYACFPRILPYKDLYKFQFQGRLTCYHWHNNQPKRRHQQPFLSVNKNRDPMIPHPHGITARWWSFNQTCKIHENDYHGIVVHTLGGHNPLCLKSYKFKID